MLELQFARIEWTVGGEVTTVTEVSPPCKILKYEPRAPRERVTRTRGMGVGSWPVAHLVENVTETIALSVSADAPRWLRTLNSVLTGGRAWAEGFRRDMRMVIRVRDTQRHGANEWFEARLFGGSVKLVSSQGRVLRLTIEREPYWSGAEAILQVMNTGTSWAWANQATIYNHDDGEPGHNNWVLVNAPDGDVPTPMRIIIHNTYSENRLKEVRVGWYDRPHQLTLEGENADGGPWTDADVKWSNSAIARASRFTWTLPNTGVADYVGMFRVLAQGNLPGDWELTVGYELTKLQELGAVAGGSGWTDLGAVVLPPGMYSHPTRYDMKVWLEGSQEGYLDFILFLPVGQFRRLRFKGYNALPNTCLEDDGVRGELVYIFGSERLPILDAWGFPIELWPDDMLPQALPGPTPPNEQMLSFALEDDHGNVVANRTAEVQVLARARYAVLP